MEKYNKKNGKEKRKDFLKQSISFGFLFEMFFICEGGKDIYIYHLERETTIIKNLFDLDRTSFYKIRVDWEVTLR